ncbi:MAG: Npt1/Npt2 family nucleotide transporter [Thermodesulfobacteriota bacterium]
MIKFLGKWLKVYEDEIHLFFWSVLLFFTIHVADILLNNFGETAFLKRYGVEYLPIIYMVNAVSTFFIMSLLTGVMARTPSSRILFFLLLTCAGSIGVIRLVIPFGFDIIYPVIYILKSQFEVLLGLLFWDMANDLFNTRQSKRLFPLLTAGGTLGGILGSYCTHPLARAITIDNLMWVYLGACVAGALVVRKMAGLFPSMVVAEKKSKKKAKSGLLDELRKVLPIIRESLLVKILIVLTLVPNMVIPIINYLFNFAVDQTFGTEGGMIKFFGYFRGSMNIVSFVVLLFVGRLYSRWGLPAALLFHPVNYVVAFLAYLFRFDVYSAIYSQLSTSVLRNTINNPARAVLMGLFPPEQRSAVRPFLRGTVVRIGILAGSGTIMAFQGLMHPRYLSLVAIVFVSAWLFANVVLKKRYSQILLDLISRNVLDLKSLESEDVSQIFLDKKVQSQLVQNFLASKGETCLWYAQLMKSLGFKDLDQHILSVIQGQDDRTVIKLLGLLSGNAPEQAIRVFEALADKKKPERTIAVLKAAARMSPEVSAPFLKKVFDTFPHPEIKALAVIGLYRRDPETYRAVVQSWFGSSRLPEKRAGIIAAGGSRNPEYVGPLLERLKGEREGILIALTLESLHLLRAEGLNEVVFPYLKHASERVRRAALKAVSVTDDEALRAVIPLLGDASEDLRSRALAKLQEAPHQSGLLLIESLGIPNRKLREGVFSLLQSLQIKDVDVLRFARSQVERAYTHVAEVEALARLEESPETKLLVEHLLQRKKERVETVLRVLAAQDPAGRVRLIQRGVFSSDARQRANALEALEDTLGAALSRIMVPLLEDLPFDRCLEAGKKFAHLPQFDSNPRTLYAHLLGKQDQDWVSQVLTLDLIGKRDLDGLDPSPLQPLLESKNLHVQDMANRVMKRNASDSTRRESAMETGISITDKILHLRSIHIFQGLSVSELAAVASVTEEVTYPVGTVIIREGEAGETMYLVIEGEVAVLKEAKGGPQVELDHIRGGDYFGEMALFEDLVRSATVRSEQETRVLVLHKREFTEIVREYPLIALQICRVLSQRLRKLHEKIRFYENEPNPTLSIEPPTRA